MCSVVGIASGKFCCVSVRVLQGEYTFQRTILQLFVHNLLLKNIRKKLRFVLFENFVSSFRIGISFQILQLVMPPVAARLMPCLWCITNARSMPSLQCKTAPRKLSRKGIYVMFDVVGIISIFERKSSSNNREDILYFLSADPFAATRSFQH